MDEVYDLVGMTERLLAKAQASPEVTEAEAFASHNVVTMARIETLARAGVVGRPSVQQLKRLDEVGVAVKVVVRGAVGQASTMDLTPRSLERLVERAVSSARMMRPDPNFVSLATPIDRAAPRIAVDSDILGGSVEGPLADAAEAAIAQVGDGGLELAGSIMAAGSKVALLNSHGIELRNEADTFAVAQFTVEQMEGPRAISSGMGWSTSRHMAGLDAADAVSQGSDLAGIRPQRSSVPEGDYNVVLGEYAVADILDNMLPNGIELDAIYMGMSWLPTETRKLRSGREAPTPKLGEEVAVPGFSIASDPTLEDAILSHSHDDEGIPTRRVELIKDGIFSDVIGTSYWSYLYDRVPTGSGIRRYTDPGRCAGASLGTYSTNLVVSPGDMTLEELIEASEGPTIYIPRTWYTYTTRYGSPGFSSSNRSTAFVVDRGELVPVPPNAFKLTGDIEKMLQTIYGVGKEQKTATTWLVMTAPIVPKMACRGIRVSKPAGEQ